MIVLIAGPPGANKTRVAELLGQEEGWCYIGLISHNLEDEAMRMRRISDKRRMHDRYRFYKKQVRTASEKIAKLRNIPKINVVIDEYWPDVLAVHRWLGVQAEMKDFGNIVREDAIVHLTVSHSTSVSRLNRHPHANDLVIADPARFKALHQTYGQVIEQYAPKKVVKANVATHRNENAAVKAILTGLIKN